MSVHGGQLTQTGDGAGDRSAWGVPVPIDLESFNADLEDGRATVDVGIIYPANLQPAHRQKVELKMVLDGAAEARRIFGAVGVQLAVVSVRTGPVDPALLVVQAEAPGSEVPGGRYANLYVERQKRPSKLSPAALAAFETVIGNRPDHDRRIHLLVLEDVFHVLPRPDRRAYLAVEDRCHQCNVLPGLLLPGHDPAPSPGCHHPYRPGEGPTPGKRWRTNSGTS